jgi:hypothetical protein
MTKTNKPQLVSDSSKPACSVFRIQRSIRLGDWEDFSVRTPITTAEQVCQIANDYNERTPEDVIFRPVEIITIVTELKHNADLERTARSDGTLQDFVGGSE